jgi:superfamily II DNA/RNA helicase
MACAQTGSGKTAAFLFPMISVILRQNSSPGGGGGRSSYPRGLILAPTRELVQQIFDEARKFCYKTGASRCAVDDVMCMMSTCHRHVHDALDVNVMPVCGSPTRSAWHLTHQTDAALTRHALLTRLTFTQDSHQVK